MRRKGDWTTNLPEEAVEALLGSGAATGVPGGPNDRDPGQEAPETDPEVLEVMQGAPEGAADAVAPPTVFDLPGRGGKDYMSANLERAHNYQGVLTHRRRAGSDPPIPCTMLSAVHPALTNRLEDLGEMEIPVASIQGSAIKDAWPSIDSDNVQKFLDIWFETGSLDDVGDPFKVIKVGDGHWLIDGHNRFAVLRKVDPSGVIRAHVVERFPMEIPMSDPTRASAARTAGNQIYFEGEGNGEMELEEFLTLNEFEPEEAEDIRATIARGDTYRGGGGAAPEWFVRPASQIAARLTTSADDVQVGNVLVHIPTGKRFRLTGTPSESPNGYWTYESLDGGDAGPGWTDEELRKNLLKGNFRVESHRAIASRWGVEIEYTAGGQDQDLDRWAAQWEADAETEREAEDAFWGDLSAWMSRTYGGDLSVAGTIVPSMTKLGCVRGAGDDERQPWRFGSVAAHLAQTMPEQPMRRSGGSPPDHLIDEMDIPDAIKAHPMYTQADYTYLHDKGYDDGYIVQLWDRDHAAGNKPVDWGIDPVNFTYPEDYREGGRTMGSTPTHVPEAIIPGSLWESESKEVVEIDTVIGSTVHFTNYRTHEASDMGMTEFLQTFRTFWGGERPGNLDEMMDLGSGERFSSRMGESRQMLAEGVVRLETSTVTAGQAFAEGMRILDVRQGIRGEIRAVASRDGLQFGTVRWADGTTEKDVPLHNGDFGIDTHPDEDEARLEGMFGTPAIQNAARRHTARAIRTGRPVQAIQNTGTPRLVRRGARCLPMLVAGTPVLVDQPRELGLSPIRATIIGQCEDGYYRVRTAEGEDEVPPEVIQVEDCRTSNRRMAGDEAWGAASAPGGVQIGDRWEEEHGSIYTVDAVTDGIAYLTEDGFSQPTEVAVGDLMRETKDFNKPRWRKVSFRHEAPANVKDHDKWEKAKKAAEEQYGGPGSELGEDRFYAAVNSIYQNMGGEFTHEGQRAIASHLQVGDEVQDPFGLKGVVEHSDWIGSGYPGGSPEWWVRVKWEDGTITDHAENYLTKISGRRTNGVTLPMPGEGWDVNGVGHCNVVAVDHTNQTITVETQDADTEASVQYTLSFDDWDRDAIERMAARRQANTLPAVGTKWKDTSNPPYDMQWEVMEVQHEMKRILLKALDGTDYQADISFDEWERQIASGELQPARL